MCQFLSAIITRDGNIYMMPNVTDSHSELVEWCGLQNGDDDRLPGFAKVQFSPPEGGSLANIEAYRLTVEEECSPIWFDDSMCADIEAKLRHAVQAMIIDSPRTLLLGGCWILVGEAKVQIVKTSRILAMYGSSRVEAMYDSSRVEAMYDSSRVGTMYGSSSVGISDKNRIEIDRRVIEARNK